MDRESVLTRVKNEIEALASREIQDLDEEIFTSGLVDSLNILNIITFIETEFNIAIDPFDVNLEMLGTVNRLCNYILSKRKN